MFENIQQRELTLGEILINSWSIFSKNFRTILLIALIIYIPINILVYMIPTESLMNGYGEVEGFWIYIRLIQMAQEFFGVLAIMGIAVLVEGFLRGEETRLDESMNKAFSRWGNMIMTNLFKGIIVMGLMFLFIIPGIIWYVFYSFVAYVVVLRNIRGMQALAYSKRLVKGRWWKIFGITLFLGAARLGLGLGFDYLIGIILPGYSVANIFIESILTGILSYFTVATVVLFLNLDYVQVERRINFSS
ncbi:MAG: hypothetical protein KAX49_03365 [Halanaerobiales bacterium]|nr:hypothetical protein [Halanaerobiales bacterium]